MSNAKKRVTLTLDAALVEVGNRAVATGTARSLSAWVNDALTSKVAHDRRLSALDAVLADYESEHGAITEEEMEAQARSDRGSAIRVASKDRPASA
ncbi:MAG TPA: hypothetical protein VFW71_08900 [Actinomycetota bacterium]|nr:hypothetical protein [Actinomycetota bacterium]